MTWYALCDGRNLRECGNCRRNADNQPLGSIGEHQAMIVPQIHNDHCADWMAIPRAKREDLL